MYLFVDLVNLNLLLNTGRGLCNQILPKDIKLWLPDFKIICGYPHNEIRPQTSF